MNTGGGADVFGAWHPQNSVSTASEYSVLQSVKRKNSESCSLQVSFLSLDFSALAVNIRFFRFKV